MKVSYDLTCLCGNEILLPFQANSAVCDNCGKTVGVEAKDVVVGKRKRGKVERKLIYTNCKENMSVMF